MEGCYIVDAIRTPRGLGKPSGSLYRIPAVSLLAQTFQALKSRQNDFKDMSIDDVLTGCVMPIGEQGANIARSAILKAGYSVHIPGMQINRFCSSGLESVNLAACKIMANQADLCIASGVESMSKTPILADGGALAADPSITYEHDIIPQGISADLIATLRGYTRTQLDNYALASQKRAKKAQQAGYLTSIIPVQNALGGIALDTDEHPRPDTTLKKLAMLSPAFKVMGEMAGYNALALHRYPKIPAIQHLHHAGNSSGIVDGASAVLLASKQAIKKHQLKPKAQIIATAQVGVDPTIMLTGPTYAALSALKRAKLSAEDIDLWEINEAFSSVVLNFMEALSLPIEKVNVNGGAIAYGHPLGATGTMLVGTLVDELIRRKKTYGCVALCTAAGMATAAIIKRTTS